MESTPAAYLVIACNEALKADIKYSHSTFWCIRSANHGRLESEIDSAAAAAKAILDKLNQTQTSGGESQLA